MLIATWNVNSIRARQDRLIAWLVLHQPDALCLQEVKVEEKAFPFAELREAGYHAVLCGQRTYNGVAILAREEPADVQCGIPDDPSDDDQARFIAATIVPQSRGSQCRTRYRRSTAGPVLSTRSYPYLS